MAGGEWQLGVVYMMVQHLDGAVSVACGSTLGCHRTRMTGGSSSVLPRLPAGTIKPNKKHRISTAAHACPRVTTHCVRQICAGTPPRRTQQTAGGRRSRRPSSAAACRGQCSRSAVDNIARRGAATWRGAACGRLAKRAWEGLSARRETVARPRHSQQMVRRSRRDEWIMGLFHGERLRAAQQWRA